MYLLQPFIVISDLRQNLNMTATDSSKISDNPLYVSWCDSAWIPVLNQSNVMDYFTERTNPFYDRTCNNEVLKMQKLGVLDAQLTSMQGTEYCLLHVQEPILYVIRKQLRHSPTQVTPVSDYYIIAGVIYQAPDLGSVLVSVDCGPGATASALPDYASSSSSPDERVLWLEAALRQRFGDALKEVVEVRARAPG